MTTTVSVIGKSIMLDSININMVGLHSGDTGLLGVANEISSTNYTRQPCIFDSSDAVGIRYMTDDVSFELSSGDIVTNVSYWDGTTFLFSRDVDLATFSSSGYFIMLAGTTMVSL